MKKIIYAIVTIALIAPIVSFAHGGIDLLSADEITNSIKTEQNVSDIQLIDCDTVDNHTLEELGDAVMSLRHPDAKIHEYMDDMMGGEGSKSLTNAHIIMAKEYLDCSNYQSFNMMKDGGVMSGTYSSQNNMYEHHGLGMNNFINVFGITAWIFLILGIIWLIKNLISSKK